MVQSSKHQDPSSRKGPNLKHQIEHAHLLELGTSFLELGVWSLELQRCSKSSRTLRTPSHMFLSFCFAAHLAVWLKPQSGANESRSGAA